MKVRNNVYFLCYELRFNKQNLCTLDKTLLSNAKINLEKKKEKKEKKERKNRKKREKKEKKEKKKTAGNTGIKIKNSG